jgi:NADPH-dependent glutamate synthase beta subunit-like oxidoreductase/Pyruvate/2-oxoacid:ferredoxin oxidoreductase delta subunit
MAEMKVVKKVTKLGGRGGGGAGKSEDTGLRPNWVEKMPPCTYMCPSAEDIRGYLTYIAQSDKYGRTYPQAFEAAWHLITNKNPFPAVMGRVCPHPCEGACNRGKLDTPVAINSMERWVGDYGIEKKLALKKVTDEKRAEKVAVVGGGPAGFSCAYQLARRGYAVTVFEGAAKVGGMLRYGIPSYRLPEEVIDAEFGKILDLGVELRTNVQVGRDVTLEELRSQYQAVYLAIGAQKGVNLGIPGEDAPNCFSGVDFLQRITVGEKIEVGDKVIVIGGGNTAIDAARTSRRLGAHVTLVYRRTRKEMPAIEHEIHEAEHEGVVYEFLSAPLAVVVENGRAVGVKCQRMELGEPDASGRRRPVPVAGSEYVIPATAVIAGISQVPVWAGLEAVRSEKGWIDVNAVHETALPGVFAGGDVTVGLGIATQAIGLGRQAADAIDRKLRNAEPAPPDSRTIIRADQIVGLQLNAKKPRNERVSLPVAERLAGFVEVEKTYAEHEAIDESKRCLSCGLCCDCDNCFMYCQDKAVDRLDKSLPIGQHYKVINEKCIGCKKCAEACLCGMIDMK